MCACVHVCVCLEGLESSLPLIKNVQESFRKIIYVKTSGHDHSCPDHSPGKPGAVALQAAVHLAVRSHFRVEQFPRGQAGYGLGALHGLSSPGSTVPAAAGTQAPGRVGPLSSCRTPRAGLWLVTAARAPVWETGPWSPPQWRRLWRRRPRCPAAGGPREPSGCAPGWPVPAAGAAGAAGL